MAAQEALQLKKRDGSGTGAARECRRQGMVPGIVYGANQAPQSISIDPKTLIREMHTPGFFSRVIHIDTEGTKEQALVKDVQIHPVTDLPMHIDFMRVAKGSKINVHIPIHFINEDKSAELKRGGVLNVVHHTLEVICPVDSVPESFTVDLGTMDISKGVHIADLKLPSNIKAAHGDRDNTIATVVLPKAEKEESSDAAAE